MADDVANLRKLTFWVAISFVPTLALIAHLFSISGPSAVIRLIPFVIADTVQGLPAGSRSHVDKELGERINPLGANRNTPAPIIPVSRVAGVETSLLHIQPRYVFAAVSSPVNFGGFRCPLFLKASTATMFTYSKFISGCYRYSTTTTVTHPFRVSSVSDNKKSSEYFPGEIQSFHVRQHNMVSTEMVGLS